jgi:hypothetical protein
VAVEETAADTVFEEEMVAFDVVGTVTELKIVVEYGACTLQFPFIHDIPGGQPTLPS